MIIGDCWRVAAEAGVELVPVIWLCRSLAPTLTGRSPRRLARPRLGSLPCQLKLKQSGSPPPTPHHHSTAPRLCQKWINSPCHTRSRRSIHLQPPSRPMLATAAGAATLTPKLVRRSSGRRNRGRESRAQQASRSREQAGKRPRAFRRRGLQDVSVLHMLACWSVVGSPAGGSTNRRGGVGWELVGPGPSPGPRGLHPPGRSSMRAPNQSTPTGT